jgi:hypothetical protein
MRSIEVKQKIVSINWQTITEHFNANHANV